MSKLRDVESKFVSLKRIAIRGLGAESPAAGGYGGLGRRPPVAGRVFVIFLEKISILMPLDHISHVLEPFENTRFLRIWPSQFKFNNLFNERFS